MEKVSLSELNQRMMRFRTTMDQKQPEWKLALFISKINQYYFTGTMQDALLVIPRDQEAVYLVRRSYERALDESLFPNIKPMDNYRDAINIAGKWETQVHIEAETMPMAYYQRLQKYFGFTGFSGLEQVIASVRSIKSSYELSLMKESGRIHRHVMEDLAPGLLKEGMTEAEFATLLYSTLVAEGHQGIVRFSMFDTDMLIGQIGFGENSLYPTFFNGPGGSLGVHPAAPVLGSRERRLKKGDLVFVDAGCAVGGYHTDKTMTYLFGGTLSNEAQDIHRQCVAIQDAIASQLKPGAIPSRIYKDMIAGFDNEFLKDFMGFGKRRVKFLGHGIGLVVDEWPVIAEGFDEPIQAGMAFALEPKKGIEGIGMVGIENTFIVEETGSACITGSHKGLAVVEA